MADKLSKGAMENAADEDGKEEREKSGKDGSAEKRKIKKMKKPQERKFDWPKKNYFDIVLETGGEGGSGDKMKNLVHRLVCIGKLREHCEDRMEVGSHYDHLMKNLQNNYSTEPITGLLLLYLKHLVHVIEASSDMITEIMRDVVREQCDFIEDCKILVISHDIPTRLYQQWSFRTLDIQAARMESYEASEGADKIIVDILSQMMKLGHKLALTPKSEEKESSAKKEKKISIKSTLDTLHDKFADLLPQQGHINYLMEENDTTMMTANEYLDMYEKPYDVVLESEMVWPLPTKLFPYN